MQEKLSYDPMAEASFVVGIVGVFAYQIFFIIPMAAVLLGALALSGFDPEKYRGKWMALAGLILGIIYSLFEVESVKCYNNS